MKRASLIVLIAAGVLAIGGGAVLVGCGDSGSDRPPASQLKEGTNLLDVRDPSAGMSAAFVKGGRAVYVQTRVGGLKPDVYRQTSPNEPPNETDLRFVDQDGKTFYVQRGGDSFVDPSWEKELEASMTRVVDAAKRNADFELAKEAAFALALALPAGFEHHTFHLSAFAAMPTPTVALADVKAQGETGYALGSWSTTNGAYTQLWSHKLCWAWTCPAWHSSTVTYNGSNQVVITSCNHGACGSSGNSYQCTSGGTASGKIDGETSGSVGTVSGGCLTGYNWNTPPGHECNDDAAYQLSQTKVGTPSTPWGDEWHFNRSDLGHNYACDCNINGCSGDWQRPACP